MNIRKNLRVVGAFAKAEVQDAMTYRLGGLAWVLNGSIGSLLLMYIWTLVNPDKSQIVMYFLGILLLNRLTQTWSFDRVAEKIKDGTLAQTLLRPYHFVYEELAHDFGHKANRLMSMIPFIIILFYLFSEYTYVPDYNLVLLAVPSVILAYFLNLTFWTSFSLLTNWTGDSHGIGRTLEIVSDFASGYVVPFILMPIWLKNILNVTPFRYLVSFPLEIMLGSLSHFEIVTGYLMLGLWLVIMCLIFSLLDRLSMKSFSSYGN